MKGSSMNDTYYIVIVIRGDNEMVDYDYYGPFASNQAARSWARQHENDFGYAWKVKELSKVKES
jgi:hypothetical protein